MEAQHLTHKIKAVKNSAFIREASGDYVALHYDSEIFRAGTMTSKDTPDLTLEGTTQMKSLYVPSVTSSKMAKRAFEYVFGYVPQLKEWKQLKERFNK